MAVWDPLDSELDWRLVQNGFCTAFHRSRVLEATALWLADQGYHLVRFDAARWTDDRALHNDFAMNLAFPDYYGMNGHALVDCLRDVAEAAYGWHAHDTGLVLVLDGFATFHKADEAQARFVLNVLEQTCQLGAMFGNRILCLVQCDDQRIDFGEVGGRPVEWSPPDGWSIEP